jgi:hypothetical protein
MGEVLISNRDTSAPHFLKIGVSRAILIPIIHARHRDFNQAVRVSSFGFRTQCETLASLSVRLIASSDGAYECQRSCQRLEVGLGVVVYHQAAMICAI